MVGGVPYRVGLPVKLEEAKFNPLEWIQGANPAALYKLSQSDIRDMTRAIVALYDAFDKLAAMPPPSLVHMGEALAYLCQKPPQAGLSKWASYQMVDSCLKTQLANAGETPKNDGDLVRLAGVADYMELAVLPPELLSKVQCDVGVLYGETEVSTQEATDAHHAAILLCAQMVD